MAEEQSPSQPKVNKRACQAQKPTTRVADFIFNQTYFYTSSPLRPWSTRQCCPSDSPRSMSHKVWTYEGRVATFKPKPARRASSAKGIKAAKATKWPHEFLSPERVSLDLVQSEYRH